VPVPLGDDHGRRLLGDGLHAVERDPHRPGQPGRRPGLHRPDPLRHPHQDRAQALLRLIHGPRRGPLADIAPMSQQLVVSLGQYSDKGRKAVNQDFHGACIPPEPQLSSKGIAIALADGIGSSAVSHIASEAAVGSFLEDYYCTADAWSVKKSAQRVLMAANAWLYAQTRQSQYRYDMDRGYVCTLSALVLKATSAHLFHAGDTRICRLRGDELERL